LRRFVNLPNLLSEITPDEINAVPRRFKALQPTLSACWLAVANNTTRATQLSQDFNHIPK
jgi:hypothetical protein